MCFGSAATNTASIWPRKFLTFYYAAELVIDGRTLDRPVNYVLARIIPLATLLALALLVSALGTTILPPRGIALSLVILGVVLAVVLWRSLVKLHARLQAALKETLDKPELPGDGSG